MTAYLEKNDLMNNLEKSENIKALTSFLSMFFKFIQESYIDMLMFHNITNLPFFISEKTFMGLFPNVKKIEKTTLIQKLIDFYYGDIFDISNIIFSALDTNKERLIDINTVKLFFSHFNIFHQTNTDTQSLEEMGFDIISSFFKGKTTILFSEFSNEIMKENSDLVYLFYFFYAEGLFVNCESFNHYLSKFYSKYEGHKFDKTLFFEKKIKSKKLYPPSELLLNFLHLKFGFIIELYDELNELDQFESEFQNCKRLVSNLNQESDTHQKNAYLSSFTLNKLAISNTIDYKTPSRCTSEKGLSNLKPSIVIEHDDNINIPMIVVKDQKAIRYYMDIVGNVIFFYRNKSKLKMIIPLFDLFLDNSFSDQEENPLTRGYYPLTFYSTISNKCKKLTFYFESIEIFAKLQNNFRLKRKEKYFNESRYGKIDILDKGSFGQILKAYDTFSEREVVFKVINKNYGNHSLIRLIKIEKYISLFLKNKPHKGIIPILDVYETKDQLIIIEEYMPNGNLQSYLINNSLESHERDEIIKQIAESINFLHSYGIAHRDLKLENILVDTSVSPIQTKIIDFGLSKIVAFNETMEEKYGTLLYLPPEIIENEKYTHKIDIWDFGIIAFSIINSGNHPFSSESELTLLLHKISSQQFDYRFIEPKYKLLLNHCLQKESKRVSSKEVLTLLKDIN